jgi:hypothetical protein
MKRVSRFSILTAVAFSWLALVPGRLLAQPVAGDNEVEVSGGFFHAQGSDTGALNADLHYGYYLTKGWELGLRQALNYNFIDHHRDVWTATTTPFLRYNFPFDKIVPYLGANLGLVWNDRDVTGTVGPDAGLKVFLNSQTYFTAGYRYEFFFDRIREVGDNSSRGNHVVSIGLGYAWGGAERNAKP